jgi:hypothetical protein
VRGKNILWLAIIAMVATTAIVSTIDVQAAIYTTVSVDPTLVETADCRFHYPVVGELVGVETHTIVTGELVGVETYTGVVGEAVGVGDGSTTVFQLANTPVVPGTETVYRDGHAVSPSRYTIDDWTGTVTFDKAPKAGYLITADYMYGLLAFSLAETPVIPESETVYVDAAVQTRDVDYTIDPWSGSLVFGYLLDEFSEVTADYTAYIAEFSLAETPVDPESETVYLDAAVQTRDVDYTIDYWSGLITFLGVPGDTLEVTADYSWWERTFSVDINIANVTELWAFGFKLDFAPFTSVLNIIDVIEGDFLSEGAGPGEETWFTSSVDTFNGILTVGCTRKSPPPIPPTPREGVSGDGLLVTVVFDIVEAGRSEITLYDVVLINEDLVEIDPLTVAVVSGAYHGPIALLKHPPGGITKRKSKVGDTKEFSISVENPGEAPLYVKVRFTFQRADGEAAYIWTGQSYTGFGPNVIDVAYVDGYIPIWNDWTAAGPPEALIGPPDGTYIQSTANCQLQGLYTFEDIDLMGRIVQNTEFYAYSKCANTGGDIDSMICWLGDYQLAWGNSQGGTLDWAWTNKFYYWPAYNFPEYYGFPTGDDPLCQDAINSVQMALHDYHVDGAMVDAYKMEVTYSKYTPAQGAEVAFVVQPGETVTLPSAVWFLSSYDTGKFYATATLHYSYYGTWFIRGQRTKWGDNPTEMTFNFDVLP